MDGRLLNFMVGEYLKAIGSEVAKEFQELTKAAAPLPALTPKLEMPEPEEEEADNPSLDKRSKKVRNCSVERTRVFLLSTIGLHQCYKALSLPGIDCFKEVAISM